MLGKKGFDIFRAGMMVTFALVVSTAVAWAAEQSSGRARSQTLNISNEKAKVRPKKGVTVKPGAFQVKEIKFQEIEIGGKTRLAAAVIFNREIDPASVQQNVNIRLLRKNDQHFWVDASTQGNSVQVAPLFIRWLSGAELKTGVYIIHLRGTLKSKDGVFLDCNGDGKGEGGALPPYESQMYNAQVEEAGLTPIDAEAMDRMKRIIETIEEGEEE